MLSALGSSPATQPTKLYWLYIENSDWRTEMCSIAFRRLRAKNSGEEEWKTSKYPSLKVPVVDYACCDIEVPLERRWVVEEDTEKEPWISFKQVHHAERNPKLFRNPLFHFTTIPRDGRGWMFLIPYSVDDRLGGKCSGQDRIGNPLSIKGVHKPCRISCQQYPSSCDGSPYAAERDKVALNISNCNVK